MSCQMGKHSTVDCQQERRSQAGIADIESFEFQQRGHPDTWSNSAHTLRRTGSQEGVW